MVSQLSLHILVAVNNKNDFIKINRFLATSNSVAYKLTWAKNQAEVLRFFENYTYDGILIDYIFNDNSGPALIHQIIKAGCKAPLILLTDRHNTQQKLEAIQAGATEILAKNEIEAPLLETTIRFAIDRKNMEMALNESEERFQQVASSISDHIYVTEITEDGSVVNRYLSPQIENLTGHLWEKFMVDWHFWQALIHPNDLPIAATFMEQLRQGINGEVEYRLLRADGQIIWLRDSARVKQANNSTTIYGVVSNITGRKQNETEIQQLNESLEQRVADRTRELSALYDVTAVAGQLLNLKNTMERSLERVLAAMRSSVGAIHLLDEASGVLHPAAQQGIQPEIAGLIDANQRGGGLPGKTLKDKEALIIPNLFTDSRVAQSASAGGLQTYVGVPIRAGGQMLGVLSVFGKSKQQFNVEEVALLASIADQVGVAVENAHLRRQAEKTAVMEERSRLARELHDSVTQSLYSLALFAEAGQKQAEAQEISQAKHSFGRIGEIAEHALKEMRLLVHELRPLDLAQEGLVGALHQRLNAVESRAHIEAQLVTEKNIKLPPHIEKGLYRIAQEALNNALKHSEATSVTVYLHRLNEWVTLEVLDNGKGFNPEDVKDLGGMGLVTMQERAEKLGGQLTVLSTHGQGTRIKVKVKIDE